MVNPLLHPLPRIPGNAQGLRSQARLEETLQPRYEPATPAENPAVPYYTGLILLSVLTFGFLLFLLFKKQIKEVRFATFATVLIGVGLPILAIVQLTTDLVLREENSPASTNSPRPTDRPSPQPTEEREDNTEAPDSTDPEATDASNQEEQPEGAVVEVPLNFPNPASASGSTPNTPENAREDDSTGENPSNNNSSNNNSSNNNSRSEALTLSMVRPSRSSLTTRPQNPNSRPASTSDRSVAPASAPVSPLPRQVNPSPFDSLIRLSQGVQRTIPRRTPSQASFSLSHLDFSQPIRFERILHLQMQGLDVLALQKLLQDLDFYSGLLDGYVGRETERAIARFQATHALLPDGIFGLSTCEILDAQTPDVILICQMTALGN